MYQRILVPVDGSATSDAGLAEAMKLAQLTGGRLRLLHVVDQLPYLVTGGVYGAMPSDVLTLLREGGESVLQQRRTLVKDSGIAVDTMLVDSRGGRLCDLVVEQSKE